MSEFARQVVREEVALTSFTPTVAVQKRREKSVGAILGAEIFCHFEQADGRLRCAFSNENKYLLGETVRDWLGREHDARDFLWCERLDDELALALVAGGRVIKDVAEAHNTEREVATTLGRLPAEAPVFVHRSVGDAALAGHPNARPLAMSVRDHIAAVRAEGKAVAALGPVTEIPAVRIWNACWKWAQVATLAIGAAALVAAAYLYWRDGDGASAQAAAEVRERSLTDYDKLLVSPDAGAVLGAIHGAYRRFLADSFFGRSWNAQRIAWRREAANNVAITAQLPHKLPAEQKTAPSPEDDVQYGVPREELAVLERSVLAYAKQRKWTVNVNRLLATVRLPINVGARDATAGERHRLRRPSDERDRWHLRSMRRDLEAFGVLSRFAPPAPRGAAVVDEASASYHADRFKLELKGLEWAYQDAAGWLGERLSGGPVVLDEVSLERVPADAGGRRGWTGALVFRTVWCKTEDSCARRAETEAHASAPSE